MQELIINENTKGVLVLAEPESFNDDSWVILVESVKPTWIRGFKTYDIYRHASLCLAPEGEFGYIGSEPGSWGNTINKKFYKPNKQERDKLKDFMGRKGYKFDKQNNKLIKV